MLIVGGVVRGVIVRDAGEVRQSWATLLFLGRLVRDATERFRLVGADVVLGIGRVVCLWGRIKGPAFRLIGSRGTVVCLEVDCIFSVAKKGWLAGSSLCARTEASARDPSVSLPLVRARNSSSSDRWIHRDAKPRILPGGKKPDEEWLVGLWDWNAERTSTHYSPLG